MVANFANETLFDEKKEYRLCKYYKNTHGCLGILLTAKPQMYIKQSGDTTVSLDKVS